MNEVNKRVKSSLCKYKKTIVDILETPLKLPKLDQLSNDYKFSVLLKKMKQLSYAMTDKKFTNRILSTPNQTRDNSYRDDNLHSMTWKNLAYDNNKYKESYKGIELQNHRISRLRRIKYN